MRNAASHRSPRFKIWRGSTAARSKVPRNSSLSSMSRCRVSRKRPPSPPDPHGSTSSQGSAPPWSALAEAGAGAPLLESDDDQSRWPPESWRSCGSETRPPKSAWRRPDQAGQSTSSLEKSARGLGDGAAASTGSQKQRHELRVGEARSSMEEDPLPRALLLSRS